jgi:hypothetical protein
MKLLITLKSIQKQLCSTETDSRENREIIAGVLGRAIEAWQAAPEYQGDDNFMLVRKPQWTEDRTEKGEYVCCGGYTPCRGECAIFEPATEKK